MRKKLESGELEDGHGKHDNHPAVDSEIKDLVRDHIKSLPSRQSHYLRADNAGHTYLSPDLSIARLYHKFLERYDVLHYRKNFKDVLYLISQFLH